ncbi:hypothetical protein GW17_00045418 [Ensete ventricosum]|nr:hypothetical protein GW17_00045418 [Ensete ventricosum]
MQPRTPQRQPSLVTPPTDVATSSTSPLLHYNRAFQHAATAVDYTSATPSLSLPPPLPLLPPPATYSHNEDTSIWLPNRITIVIACPNPSSCSTYVATVPHEKQVKTDRFGPPERATSGVERTKRRAAPSLLYECHI